MTSQREWRHNENGVIMRTGTASAARAVGARRHNENDVTTTIAGVWTHLGSNPSRLPTDNAGSLPSSERHVLVCVLKLLTQIRRPSSHLGCVPNSKSVPSPSRHGTLYPLIYELFQTSPILRTNWKPIILNWLSTSSERFYQLIFY